MKNSFNLIKALIFLILLIAFTSCTTQKKHKTKCRGLKAHPHYSKIHKR